MQNPSLYSYRALSRAIVKGDLSELGPLFRDMADGKKAAPALAMASSFSLDIRVLRLLIKFGADMDARSKYGWTALMFAASASRKAALEELIRQGANRSLTNNLGQTAMDLANKSAFPDAGAADALKRRP